MTVCKDLVFRAKEQAREILMGAVGKAMREGVFTRGPLPDFTVEIPADVSHGDFASNIAMLMAKPFGMPPQKISAEIVSRLDFKFHDSYFVRAEIAGPGFINLFLDKRWFADVLRNIWELGEAYGHTNYGQGEKVMVEFVSANPTGPMHMGNARGGAIGDCLAAALDAAGYDVAREFYVNDAGNQIEKFGASLEARYMQIFKGEDAVAFPDDGYQGEDIKDLARHYADAFGDKLLAAESAERRHELIRYAMPRNINAMREDLFTYRIDYEKWFHESTLHRDGTVEEVIDILREKELTYEKDGALWYKATEFGGEKDEVLLRQNGVATYFAADIAYHYNKFTDRGFSRVIDVWGADHHGHVARLKGAMDAIGLAGDKLDIVLMQLVRLMKDGEPYRMSKRTGRSVTLADLLELVPVDAARFFFNLTSPKSSMDFDLDLAVKQSSDNPVYYVQYAHARICSIIKKVAESGIEPRTCTADELSLLTLAEETELIRKLAQYPQELIGVAVSYDPARITRYLIDLATLFHKFYTNCHVAVDDENLMHARLFLCLCSRITISNALELMRISAPETM